MTPLQFITSKEFGCCTTSELMAFAKVDKAGFETLKTWAIAEMGNRGIEVK
jgi:hypothetical protein